MNQTHIHLLITHLPIIGSMLGALVLIHGIFTKSDQSKIAAYNIFILSSIGAVIAYFTGEGAEETVENLQGVIESTIKEHEESALYAFISLIILGVISILGFIATVKKSSITRTLSFVILIISVISFGLVARTGYLGGKIRHTEISNSTTIPSQNSEKETDE
jgi:uncharacterized membrane protein